MTDRPDTWFVQTDNKLKIGPFLNKQGAEAYARRYVPSGGWVLVNPARNLETAATRLLQAAQDIVHRLDTEHRYISQDAQLELERAIDALKGALGR